MVNLKKLKRALEKIYPFMDKISLSVNKLDNKIDISYINKNTLETQMFFISQVELSWKIIEYIYQTGYIIGVSIVSDDDKNYDKNIKQYLCTIQDYESYYSDQDNDEYITFGNESLLESTVEACEYVLNNPKEIS